MKLVPKTSCLDVIQRLKHLKERIHQYLMILPPPFPVLQYMQFMEDYSEPQPSVFYQMPQSESIYEQRNKRFQEVYGFNDSFSSTDSVHEPLQPPALPPKQRQLVRDGERKRTKTCPTSSKPPGQVFFRRKNSISWMQTVRRAALHCSGSLSLAVRQRHCVPLALRQQGRW